MPALGVGGDLAFFAPEVDTSGGAEYYVLSITPLVMVRIPLESIHPYAAVGPGLFVSVVDLDFSGPGVSGSYTAAAASVGADVRAGLRVPLGVVELFTEYRYSYTEPRFDDDIANVGVEVEPKLSTHHVRAGLGFRF